MNLHYIRRDRTEAVRLTMTATEARRLARLARSYGYFAGREDGMLVRRYICPLTALVGAGGRHDVVVHHLAWETPNAKKVDAAFVQHFTDPLSHDDGGRCPHVLDEAP